MNLSRSPLVFALLLALAGCSSSPDDPTTKNNTPAPDAGMLVVDAGLIPDTGVVVPPSPCPENTEGCACEANFGPNDTVFGADGCQNESGTEDGMRCIPFDLLSGQANLTGPVQSCVRVCITDMDCGLDQACASTGYGDDSGAGSLCVDRVAGFDEHCGFARSMTSRQPDVPLRTSGEIVGCMSDYACLIGVFEDAHPDEGRCVAVCQGDDECSDETPYCNPRIFNRISESGEMVPLGVCATAKLSQGAVCGTANAAKAGGFATECDTALDTPANTFCIGTPGLLPEGQGICMTICDEGMSWGACTAFEPDGAAQACAPDLLGIGNGVCQSGCDNYPDTCTGPGAFGQGRFCMAYLADATGDALGLCMDRREPTLTGARLDASGAVSNMGDNCFAPGGSDLFTQCADPGYCEIIDFQAGTGVCVMGCGDTGTPESAAYCDSALGLTGTGTCAAAFQMGGQPITTQGLCGDTAN